MNDCETVMINYSIPVFLWQAWPLCASSPSLTSLSPPSTELCHSQATPNVNKNSLSTLINEELFHDSNKLQTYYNSAYLLFI